MTNGSSIFQSRILAASLALLLGAGTVAAHAGEAIGSDQLDASSFEAYEDSAGVVVRLLSESDLPFLYLGEPPGPNHPKYQRYRRPIARFPDVRSCLVEKERNAAKPDLTAFDWRSMGDTTHAEVCIYRIATSYRDPEGFEAWLASQGLESIGRIDTSRKSSDQKEFIIRADWPVKKKGVLLGLGNYITRKFTEFFSYSLLISVKYRESFGIYEVHVSYKKK